MRPVEGAAARVRPLIMTVATTVLGLLPLLWEAGVGADVSARTAAPVVGGLYLDPPAYQPGFDQFSRTTTAGA